MSTTFPHDITFNADGLSWCNTEGLPADFCDDETRCETGCVCNVGDPDVRDRHVALYEGVYSTELSAGSVTKSEMLVMALTSAQHELESEDY